ncbi:hypothetical protein E4U53_004786, partial [Claviceps sorghi]
MAAHVHTGLALRGKEQEEEEEEEEEEQRQGQRPAFGRAWKREFLFDAAWRNLNHGSFGTYPVHIRDKLRAYQDQAEARPDQFIRYEQPRLLDRARAAVAQLVRAPVDSVVFVGNATEGVNTVLRNLAWGGGGGGARDVVLSFSTVYEACGKAVDYLAEYYAGQVEHRTIAVAYPVEDDAAVAALRGAVAMGKRR